MLLLDGASPREYDKGVVTLGHCQQLSTVFGRATYIRFT